MTDISWEQAVGINAIINIVITLFCIGITWWALQALRLNDFFLKNTNPFQAKMLIILLSVAIGHGVASFLIEYLLWSTSLIRLF